MKNFLDMKVSYPSICTLQNSKTMSVFNEVGIRRLGSYDCSKNKVKSS